MTRLEDVGPLIIIFLRTVSVEMVQLLPGVIVRVSSSEVAKSIPPLADTVLNELAPWKYLTTPAEFLKNNFSSAKLIANSPLANVPAAGTLPVAADLLIVMIVFEIAIY